jgi:hypothetical protein
MKVPTPLKLLIIGFLLFVFGSGILAIALRNKRENAFPKHQNTRLRS